MSGELLLYFERLATCGVFVYGLRCLVDISAHWASRPNPQDFDIKLPTDRTDEVISAVNKVLEYQDTQIKALEFIVGYIKKSQETSQQQQ